jgi:uncharacterized protein (DUF2164 family)
MAIELPRDTREQAVASIKRYFAEHLDDEIGDLKATLLLDYFLEDIAPCVYNRAILDAQAVMQENVGDLEGSCYEPEFGFWREK